jgi:molecular chaperone HtpG
MSTSVESTQPHTVTEKSQDEEMCNFDADIQQLMSLIVNSFYSNNDIFLRELISNASDALDKIRYQSLTDKEALGNETDFEIRLTVDKENKTLTIEDTGVGMTNSDLKNNLGTIARSGTKNFIQAVKEGADLSMIGQFGVGFYSAFLVADKITVITKNNEGDEQLWESAGGTKFSIKKTDTPLLKRGTRIILSIKDDQHQYLEESSLKKIIKTHSEFISYPIKLWVTKTKEVEVPDDTEDTSEEKQEQSTEEEKSEETSEVKQEQSTEEEKSEETSEEKQEQSTEEEKSEDTSEEKSEDTSEEKSEDTSENNSSVNNTEEETEIDNSPKEPKMKKIQQEYQEWETLNTQKPVWTRKPEDVTDEEYNTFYKSISNDWEAPAARKHFSAEGNISLKGLVFLPGRAPFDMFQQKSKKSKVKLYVRKVFITDDCEDLMPDYLDFISGVVDSEDLPLNVSREILQQNRMLKVIRKTLIKKTLEMIDELHEDEEKYLKFYTNFSKKIKLGVYEDAKYRDRFTKLLMFNTSKSEDKLRSLDQYVDDMSEDQPGIYYITGESKEIVKNSPFVEKLHKKGWEVLYFVDPLDEYMTQQLQEYREKKLLCVTKSDLDLGDSEEEKKQLEEDKKDYETLCKQIKETLGDKVEKVTVSNRVTDSPCCLVSGQHGWTANMERIMKAQALHQDNGMNFMMSKKTMEINPQNKIVSALKKRFEEDENSIKDMVWLLYETAVLDSGFSLEQPHAFTQRINRLLALGLNVEDVEDEEIQEEELPELDDDDDDEDDEESNMETVD